MSEEKIAKKQARKSKEKNAKRGLKDKGDKFGWIFIEKISEEIIARELMEKG